MVHAILILSVSIISLDDQKGKFSFMLIVYLRASPETCLERIQKRHRSEEESISLDYLHTLHERHEEWLIKRNSANLSIPILVVDANQTKERVYIDTNTHVENLISC